MADSTRTFPLEDIRIDPGGDGRTVTAYAAVFDTPTQISDFEGDYIERIHPAAFNKAIRDAAPQGKRTTWLTRVLFNHGMTTYGTPSDRGSMPIGTPQSITADSRGLLTVTRYNNTPLADEALDAIKSGSITAQSFQGRFVRSDKKGPFRADKDGNLTVVTRKEVTLKEYGPAVFAAYPDAEIVGVRATLNPTESSLLQVILASLSASDATLDLVVEALEATDESLETAKEALAAIMGLPICGACGEDCCGCTDPTCDGSCCGPEADMAEPRATYMGRLQLLATRLDAPVGERITGTESADVGKPLEEHLARWNHLRYQARKIGALA